KSEFPVDLVEEAMANIPPDSDEIALDEQTEEQPENSNSDSDEFDSSTSVTANNSDVVAQVVAPNADSPDEDAVKSDTNKVEPTTSLKDDFQKPMWILQLGSFKHKENVVSLREKLRKAGIETYTKPVKTQAGLLSKVYVGPEQDKETLVKTQLKIKEINGLVGKITRFDTRN
ncbi:SPOR domain-containing protein, partial [Psychrosphaera sp.]|nr:SPOR domain-containing protein [Psychrosphaera sp.]